MTPTPEQVIANIREALEGTSRGNWRREETEDTAETLVVQGARDVICRVPWSRDTTGNAHRDAAYIAAVNPQNIAVLMGELDSLRKAKWDVKHVDTMNDMAFLAVALKAAEAEIDALLERVKAAEAERDALRKGLEPAWEEEDMAMHWIDRYAAGIDAEPQLDRILDCVGLRARTLIAGDNHE